jgi:aspartate racemase
MKTIGLIGGMSWESTAEYYKIINEAVRDRLGGLHSARCLLYSVDFAEIEEMQHKGEWAAAGQALAAAGQSLERGGADCLVLCTNTMHKVAADIQSGVHIPLLHIADATAGRVQANNLRRVGLLGTRFTMEEDFYRGRLEQRFGLDVRVPGPQARALVHRVIYDELCLGVVQAASREAYREIIARLAEDGAEGVILGCTEIGLLVSPADSPLPLFDTTRIHAEAAVDFSLAE